MEVERVDRAHILDKIGRTGDTKRWGASGSSQSPQKKLLGGLE